MALTPGTRLGPYAITAQIGVGGMGEVYRATDTNLKRDVAIKVLPESVAGDAERLARFQREAEVLASLNHPNIAQIHGLEKSAGTIALVMELVEGPTLADRIAQGAIPVDEALPIAKQIAEALEAAHEQGIIHRDLKPANVKVRPDGTVKVLDFGLAKALEPTGAMSPGMSQAPTITTPAMTQAGMILGTAAYMSPEQARGKPVDRRTDIWAFGAVLYEMLTGRRAFAGEDVADTLGAVIHKDVDWTPLPGGLSPTLAAYIKRCLHKDPKQRIPDIAAMRLALEGAFEAGVSEGTGAVAPAQPAWRRAVPLALASLVTAAIVGIGAWSLWPSAEPPVASRFEHVLPEGLPFRSTGQRVMALSADGRHFVYNTQEGLYLRSIGALEARLIAGTETVSTNPFFSPDGDSVGFMTFPGEMARLSIAGGAPVVIATGISAPFGASWGADNTILFGQPEGIVRVSADGGAPELVIPAREGEWMDGPQLLPDGDSVLFSATGTALDWGQAQIVVQSLQTGERTMVMQGGSAGRYLPSGHLLYAVGNTLFAVAFDADRLETRGGPVPVVEELSRPGPGSSATANYAVSDRGTLVYLSGEGLGAVGAAIATARALVWVDRQGREDPLAAPPRSYSYPRLSPDGTQVAVDIRDTESEIWVWHVVRGTLTRLTFNPGLDRFPVWSPDGLRIAFSSVRDDLAATGQGEAYWQAADGTGQAERLSDDSRQTFPNAFSPDGTRLLVSGAVAGGNANDDIGVVEVGGPGSVTPLLDTTFGERNAEVSPDGRWLAYESDESGQPEVYVRPFPDVDGGRWQVSTDGGAQPVWASDGRELFYRSDDAVLSVPVEMAESFVFGSPVELFSGEYAPSLGGRNYDVSPDGQRFLMLKVVAAPGEAPPPARFIIVENWLSELERLVPTD